VREVRFRRIDYLEVVVDSEGSSMVASTGVSGSTADDAAH
jgi:hypothetical protein